MYLKEYLRRPTFVPAQTIKAKTLKKLFSILFVMSCSWTALLGQQVLEVWPGDVNNNGIVNEVDVLLWSVAAGERGPRAIDGPSSEWAARPVEAWDGTIPGSNGLNLAFADCNGNGQINESDLQVIRRNFGQTRPENTPDVFVLGDANFDPLLSLRTEQTVVRRGETLLADVVIGDNSIEVDTFFGFVFTIPYNPNLPEVDTQGINFELAANSWMGRRNAEVRLWSLKDPATGKVHNAVYRRKTLGSVVQPEQPAGAAEAVGTYSIIIVEDIVSGLTKVDLGFENVRLTNATLTEQVLAIDSLSVPVEMTTSLRRVSKADRMVRVYPNPVHDWVVVSWPEEGSGLLQRIEVFNLLGQAVRPPRVVEENAATLDLSGLPGGTYLLRIHTREGVVSRMITKRN